MDERHQYVLLFVPFVNSTGKDITVSTSLFTKIKLIAHDAIMYAGTKMERYWTQPTLSSCQKPGR